jgi:myo-inositol-1(or 4)-monophosphatase
MSGLNAQARRPPLIPGPVTARLGFVMDHLETTVRQLVGRAGERLRAVWGDTRVVEHKGPVDLVTATDREVEALVVEGLHAAFPDHRVVAEEATGAGTPARPGPAEYAWYLDPLDGTVNFAHGVPHIAVSLALARGDELLLGIVYDPLRDEMFFARRGAGASVNGTPIAVSPVKRLDHALLATGFPYDRREHTEFYLGFLRDFLHRARDVRRAGAAALDLCYVACGRFDGFWEWRLKPWDTAAGVVIIREAGGLVTDFAGGAYDPFGEQTLASNAHVHGAMRDVLVARLGAEARRSAP